MQLLLILVGGLGILVGLIQIYRAIDRGEIDWQFCLLWGLFSSFGLIVGLSSILSLSGF